MKKRIAIISLVGILILTLVIALIILRPEDEIQIAKSGTVIAHIEYNNEVTELTQDKYGNIFNGEDCIVSNASIVKGTLLKLDLNTDSYELTEEDIVYEGVYELDISNSIGYVKQLISNGYEIKLEAETPKFIELYLQKKFDHEYLRVIISDKYLIKYEVKEVIFNINNYIGGSDESN